MTSKLAPFRPSDYSEHDEYKRLTPDEERTNKLRPNNKSLNSVNEPAYTYYERPKNDLTNDDTFTKPKYTYYPETRETEARLRNGNLSTNGGGFWDDFGRGFLMPFQALGSVAAPLASVAKAVGGAGLFPTQSAAEMKAGIMSHF